MRPRRGVPLGRVPRTVQRVLVIREGVIVNRTDKQSPWGTRWSTADGRLYAYNPQTRVKPVYTYAQVQALMKGERNG